MTEKERFVALDGVRGLAAILVAFYHFGEMADVDLVPNGALAVDLFFILSGFVIAAAYDKRLKSTVKIRVFMLRRIIRLYPMAFIGLIIGFFFYCSGLKFAETWPLNTRHLIIASAFGSFLLPVVPFPSWSWTRWPLNPPYWSLFFELAANLFYGTIGHRLRTSSLVILIIFCWAGLSARTLLTSTDAPMTLDTLRTGFGFFAGVVIFRTYRKINFRQIYFPDYLIFASVVTILHGGTKNPICQIIAPAFLILIVIGCVYYSSNKTMEKFYSVLGDISYPLYAIHFPIFWFIFALKPNIIKNDFFTVIFLSIITVTAVSFLSYLLAKLYDAPLRAKLANMLQ